MWYCSHISGVISAQAVAESTGVDFPLMTSEISCRGVPSSMDRSSRQLRETVISLLASGLIMFCVLTVSLGVVEDSWVLDWQPKTVRATAARNRNWSFFIVLGN